MEKNRKFMIRILAGFFMIMALCTVLSRAASSVLVAQVSVEGVKRGRLSYSYEGEGVVVPVKQQQIFLWPGQQVEKAAKAGSTVKAGQCIAQFRMEYLNKAVDEKQAAVQQLRLKKEQQQIFASGTERVPAAVGAGLTLQSTQVRLQEAKEKEAQAQSALEAEGFGGGQEEAPDDSEADTDAAQENKAAYTESLYQALQSAQVDVQSAQQAVEDAQNAYDIACQEDAAQNVNDANAQASSELAVQELEVQVKQAETELKKLQEYQAAGGKICAVQDCVILQAGVQAGTFTTGSEVLTIGTAGWRLKGTVKQQDQDKLSAGIKAEILLGAAGKRTVKIESVEKNTAGKTTQDSSQSEGKGTGNSESGENNTSGTDGGCWYAPLPDKMEDTGSQTFTWKAEVETKEEYEQKLPLSALRESMDGTYCLVLTDDKGMLGTVKKAKRVNVTVLEKDSEYAAITCSLGKEDQVIVSSEKFVEEGDQVRIKE